MRTERPQASREPGRDAVPQSAWRSRWRRWRSWLPFLVKPLRGGIVVFVVLLVIEYLVVPELVGASKDLYLLGRGMTLTRRWPCFAGRLQDAVDLDSVREDLTAVVQRAWNPPTCRCGLASATGMASTGPTASCGLQQHYQPSPGTGCGRPRLRGTAV